MNINPVFLIFLNVGHTRHDKLIIAYNIVEFVGWVIFRRIRKIAKSDYELRHAIPSVCLSVRMQQLCSNRTAFQEILYEYFSKIFPENSSFIQSDTSNGYFTSSPTYIFDHVSLNCS